jgi:acyl CoA:acetate/3-ketoacid CoA transferase alpha subunit/acyl CoA:acetate/3-ketoacid CoA transferase beta subunit
VSDKTTTLDAAVSQWVKPGMSIHFAYGGGRPNAAVAEIVRQFSGTKPGFTISAHGFVNSQHALLGAGLVDRLIVAFAGENFPSPRPNQAMQRAVGPDGHVTLENWSIWTLTARLMAGALGLPFFPVRSLVDSGMAVEHAGKDYGAVTAFGGPSGVVRALRPDIVLVHGLVADREGNVILAPPYGEGAWGALAARSGVIACVEKIVDSDFIRAHNSLPMIPASAVAAVCVTPFGSHPYGLSNGGIDEVEGYAEDEKYMAEFRAAARSQDGLETWTTEWMIAPGSHDGFLARLGTDRLDALRADPVPVTPIRTAADEPTADERMTLVAARVLRDRIAASDTQLVLSGIGYAHLAAWTAVTRMQHEGSPVQLAAELGMSGFHPKPGDPYLFARQNLPTSSQLADVIDVLARDVSGPATRSIGVLGAGQVDSSGNLNSTFSADGRFILGSGGANDVATGADEVIVVLRHSADRLVDQVAYITAPGRNVTTIVTTEAVLERRDGRFVVTSYLDDGDPASILESIRAGIGWPIDVAADVAHEPLPSQDDLALLRGFDPAGVFIA